jgi:multicomponent Na+:H+ antiporter subunit D
MGLGIGSQRSLAAAVFFMVHVIIAKVTLFLVSGAVHALLGTYDLKRLGGLYKHSPALALLFLIPALSLAGIPPLAGFWAKFNLVWAGIEAGRGVVTAAALGVSMLTFFSMLKIWNEAFWKAGPEGETVGADHPPLSLSSGLALYLPMTFLALLVLVAGLAAEPLWDLSSRAAQQLLHPAGYRAAVLGMAP